MRAYICALAAGACGLAVPVDEEAQGSAVPRRIHLGGVEAA